MPTFEDLSEFGEGLRDFSTAETLTRVGEQIPISNRFIHVLGRLSHPESLRARREQSQPIPQPV
jgi:hypothetical protein